MPGPAKSEKRLQIEALLAKYDEQVRRGDRRPVRGFKQMVARKFGVSAGRVTNIAREMGLTGRRP